MHALRRVREQIAMLVNGAALYQCAVANDGNRFLQSRRAVNDQELRPPQTAPNQIIENGTPGFSGFPAHVLDREQHLLAVRAHTNNHEQRDRRGLAIEPDANDCAVEDQPHHRLVG